MKGIPPPPLDGQLRTPLAVDVDILTILEIVEVDDVISLQLEVRMTWVDRRLTMTDLHEDFNVNIITSEVRERIWMPQVTRKLEHME